MKSCYSEWEMNSISPYIWRLSFFSYTTWTHQTNSNVQSQVYFVAITYMAKVCAANSINSTPSPHFQPQPPAPNAILMISVSPTGV